MQYSLNNMIFVIVHKTNLIKTILIKTMFFLDQTVMLIKELLYITSWIVFFEFLANLFERIVSPPGHFPWKIDDSISSFFLYFFTEPFLLVGCGGWERPENKVPRQVIICLRPFFCWPSRFFQCYATYLNINFFSMYFQENVVF